MRDQIEFDRVFRRRRIMKEFEEEWRRLFLARKGGVSSEVEVYPEFYESLFWRPLVRAARGDHSDYFVNRRALGTLRPEANIYREVHCDGVVELGYVCVEYPNDGRIHLGHYISVAMLANIMVQAFRVGKEHGHDLRYAIEVQIRHRKGNENHPLVIGYSDRNPVSRYAELVFDADSFVFPRYSFGNTDDPSINLKTHFRDLFHFLGRDVDDDEDVWAIEDWRGESSQSV